MPSQATNLLEWGRVVLARQPFSVLMQVPIVTSEKLCAVAQGTIARLGDANGTSAVA